MAAGPVTRPAMAAPRRTSTPDSSAAAVASAHSIVVRRPVTVVKRSSSGSIGRLGSAWFQHEAAGGDQRSTTSGSSLTHHPVTSRQHDVGHAELADRPRRFHCPRRLGRVGDGLRVALEQRDVVPVARQHDRCRCPADPSARYHDARHALQPSVPSLTGAQASASRDLGADRVGTPRRSVLGSRVAPSVGRGVSRCRRRSARAGSCAPCRRRPAGAARRSDGRAG